MSLNGLEIVDRKSISAVSRFKRTSLSFIYVLTKGNLGYIQDIIELARALEAGLIFQPAYIPENHSLRKKMSIGNLGAFDWPKLYTELREWAVMLGYERYLDLIYDSYHDRKLRPESCVMGTGAVVIDADGSVYPCFHRRELECGNIFRDELAEILHKSEKFSSELSKAQCFGEHCVSLHTHYGK
jgi:MoaA/NifB/PqqE/SkfB family radical SAM enzyme